MSRLRRILLYCGGPVILGLLIVLVAGRFTDRLLTIELQFRPTFDGVVLECGRALAVDETATGARRESVTLVSLRMLVSDVKMVRADGKVFALEFEQDGHWQAGHTALVDTQDGMTPCAAGVSEARRAVRGTVPMGNYNGVLFRLPDTAAALAAAGPGMPSAFVAARNRAVADGAVHVVAVRVATLDESGAPVPATERQLLLRVGGQCDTPGGPCVGSSGNVAVSAFEADRHGIGVEIGGVLREVLAERFPGARPEASGAPMFRPRMRRVER